MENDLDEIDLTSESVRDFIDRPPSHLIQWGTLSIWIVILVAGVLSWMVKYPTVVRAELRLISDNLPKPVTAKTDGPIERLFVTEGQQIAEGQVIGVVESNADFSEVVRLEERLIHMERVVMEKGFFALKMTPLGSFERLGESQDAFQRFHEAYLQVKWLHEAGFFQKKRRFFVEEIRRSEELDDQLSQQMEIYAEDIALAKRELEISRKLHQEKVIADLDLFKEESKTLAKLLPLKSIETARINNVSQKNVRQAELIEFEKLALVQEESFFQQMSLLKNAIAAWKKKSVLTAPVAGAIRMPGTLQEKQFVRAGQELFFVDAGTGQWLGEIQIPQNNFGRVREGQRVLIKFAGFPFEEFGAIEGRIASIAKIASGENGHFFATVDMPDGLTTNFGKTLIYHTGMRASAEIITEELRLIERLFYRLRGIVVK
jgi:multidrug efflux pump subunit AcrA (membrane-fusion protein)